MQGRFMEKIVVSMLALLLFFYVGMQISRTFGASVKTETVYSYTISQSISGTGIIFRDEQTLPETGSGVMSCLYDDGDRVLVGKPVVEYLSSTEVGINRNRLRETEWEIAMLEEAQNTSLSHFSNADALGRDIKQQMTRLVHISAAGQYDEVQTLRPNLVSLLNKRQIATGKEQGFDTRISQLTAERDRLTSSQGRDVNQVIKAPLSGYYAKPMDGLETSLTRDIALKGSLDELLSLLESPPQPAPSVRGSGRIVTNQNWYLAIQADKYDTQWVRPGQALYLVFDGVPGKVPAQVERVLTSNERDEAVLVVHCNHIASDTISLRVEGVRLEFSSYSGLRVDSSYIRFQGDEPGVYVLENNVVKFKKLNPIYEEPGFLLSEPPPDLYDATYLRQYEQIITKGKELSDGKIVD